MNKWMLISLLMLFHGWQFINAQPFLLQSAEKDQAFSLKIYYGNKGKGAFVQYTGQKGIIPLQVKSIARDSLDRDYGQPDSYSFVWNEIINGKISGEYGLTEGLRYINDAWYLRGKDRKRFSLKYTQDKIDYDGVNKYLLHGVLIEFNHYYNNKLTFRYPDKKATILVLPEIIQPNGARQSHIADYNFDGYDDVAFSVADAGMGVYQQYIIYLYQPQYRRFYQLQEPVFNAKVNCSCLCNVALDDEKKELRTSCRGGARWWQDVWRYKNGKLVWVRSEEEPITSD